MVNEDEFRKAYDSNLTLDEIGEKFGVSRTAIKNWADELGLSRGKGFRRKRKF